MDRLRWWLGYLVIFLVGVISEIRVVLMSSLDRNNGCLVPLLLRPMVQVGVLLIRKHYRVVVARRRSRVVEGRLLAGRRSQDTLQIFGVRVVGIPSDLWSIGRLPDPLLLLRLKPETRRLALLQRQEVRNALLLLERRFWRQHGRAVHRSDRARQRGTSGRWRRGCSEGKTGLSQKMIFLALQRCSVSTAS